MQSPPLWQSAPRFPPLDEEAVRRSPERPPEADSLANPDIARLLERFHEPPGDGLGSAPAPPKPAAAPASVAARPKQEALPRPQAPAKKSGLTLTGLISTAAGIALVPVSFLFFLWWQDTAPQDQGPAEVLTLESAPVPAGVEPPAQTTTTAKVALAAPDDIEPEAAARPSIMPEPPQVATVDLPESVPTPAPIATVDAPDTAPAADIAQTEQTGSIADPAPAPQRKPDLPAPKDEVRVNPVKTVTIEAPRDKRPYDGAYALGAPADEAQASDEWMETKTAVDMHAKAEQSSETVKVADGGLKVRVTGRDKRWVQVTDPETSTTGWIYDRFLKPADAPAQ